MQDSFTFEGAHLNYTVTGEGKAIVLLHGFMESGSMWNYFAEELSKEFMVVVPDLPGHGQSESIDRIHTMDLMARSVKALLDTLSIKKCFMAGHSMGGYVTMAFAQQFQEMLSGLSLFHSHAAADSPEAKVNRNRLVKLLESDKAGFIQSFFPGLFAEENIPAFSKEIKTFKKEASSLSKTGIIAAIEGMKLRSDRMKVLSDSEVPIQFIIGKDDSRIPLDLIIPQTLLPSHAEVLLLDHVGHMGFLEAADTTLAALKSFAVRSFQ